VWKYIFLVSKEAFFQQMITSAELEGKVNRDDLVICPINTAKFVKTTTQDAISNMLNNTVPLELLHY